MKKLLITVVIVAGLLSGCGAGRTIQKGINCYWTLNYQRALDIFEEAGCCEYEMNPKGLVRYLVFRGLAHYRLGHRKQAYHFLSRGKEAYQRSEPGWLPIRAVQEMDAALVFLNDPNNPDDETTSHKD
jgi:uncharacterized protein YceK